MKTFPFLSNILLILSSISLLTNEVQADNSAVQTCRLAIKVSSDNAGYEAYRACDGDPNTFWHTRFQGTPDPGPHWIELDLFSSMPIRGIVYTPRPDMHNGTFEDIEIRVYDSPDNKGTPVWSGKITAQCRQPVQPIRLTFSKAVTGRYIRIDVLSAMNGFPRVSAAEIQPIVDGKTFIEQSVLTYCYDPDADPELVAQYNQLVDELKNRNKYDKIQNQLYDPQAGILPEDKTPSDVIYRRTMAAMRRIEEGNRDLGLGIREGKGNRNLGLGNREGEGNRDYLNSPQSPIPNPQSPNNPQSPIPTPHSLNSDFARFVEIAKIRREVLFSYPELNFDKIVFLKRHRGTYGHICDQFYGKWYVPGGGVFVLENAFGEKPVVRNVLENSCELRVASCENAKRSSKVEDNKEFTQSCGSTLSQLATRNSQLKQSLATQGAFATLALNYEADTIAFAYTACTGSTAHIEHTDPSRGHWDAGRCLHIYTIKLDGTELRQLTDGTWNDFYPCFLPNGRIAFISERRGGYLRCGRECPNYTVFDMNPDGSEIRCLSFHETNEWSPSVSNDGKIIWTRWDYIDRNSRASHNPWIMSVNGSDPRQIIGNYTPRRDRPDVQIDVRAIPGSSKLVGTAALHHGHNFGSLIVIDPVMAPQEESDPMVATKRLTPDVGFPESQDGSQVWGCPYPISEDLFLAVADYSVTGSQGMEGQPPLKGNYGIYLLDRFGNRELIYRDPEIGCSTPIPVHKIENEKLKIENYAKRNYASEGEAILTTEHTEEHGNTRKNLRVTPCNSVNSVVNKYEELPLATRNSQLVTLSATVTLANVYQSLKPLPEGVKIKALRIVQIYPCSVPSGKMLHTGYEEPSRHVGWEGSGFSINLVRGVIGTVPVEEDGSAHFIVPAQREVFFQALDEKGQAVQSMRSGTYFQPGDNVSCVGCHEPKGTITKADSKLPIAFTRPASVPTCEIPSANPANFPELVQPILDKHCVECHANPESKTFSLAKEPYVFRYNRNFYQSYDNLMKNGFGFYSYGNPYRTIPGQFGARKSKLLPLLDAGHYGVKLTPEERERIVIWLDMLSPFYGVYDEPQQDKQLKGEPVKPLLE